MIQLCQIAVGTDMRRKDCLAIDLGEIIILRSRLMVSRSDVIEISTFRDCVGDISQDVFWRICW